MSRDDYDDDDDRPRRARRRRDDDDYDDGGRRRGGGERSSSVTFVGVISIIIGSLTLLCGLCVMIGSFTFLAAGPRGPQFGGANPFPLQMAGGVLVIFALLILVFGALYLTGGIGVCTRRNWGRIMTLVMGGFSILFGILQLIGVVVTLAAPAPMEAKMIQVLINVLVMGIFFTHGIMAFVVLLSGQNASEFE